MENIKTKSVKHKSNNKRKKSNSNKGIATHFAEKLDNPKRWHEELPDDPKNFEKVSVEKLIEFKDEAKKCNDSEAAAYSMKAAKTNSDYKWMKTVMSKGTLADKVAANTVLIQDNPVCNLSTIHHLINMVKVGKKNEYLVVMDTLGELFLNDLLRPDAKLKPLHERPLSELDKLTSGNSAARRKYLSIWHFEDQLKEYYTTFVQALNKIAHDSVETSKERAIKTMYKLLAGNPEQEANLLKYIINKLGDPSQKVASKTLYCLTQLLYQHPNMKQVIINEIERLLFRPNVSTKAQYYAICFLTQVHISNEENEIAKNLITLYFAFFRACVKKGEVDSRMMSAILMGVNRAYPYAKTNLSEISEHINTLYKIVHVATFNVSLHALSLIFQVSSMSDSVNDRFYCALYKKLLDVEIGTTTHQAMLLNLILRALKRDIRINRIKTFIKRLLQVALYMTPAMTCAILYLVYNIMYKNKHLLALKFKQSAITDDDKPEHYVDATTVEIDETDTVIEKKEEEMNNKDIQGNTSPKEEPITDLNDDDIKPDINVIHTNTSSSWVHCDKAIKSEYKHAPITCYDAMHRNPLYAGGEFCAFNELLQLKNHYHPTVALFAGKIISADRIIYSGDPLKDFSLIRFLERFVFKNPKKLEDVEKPGINPVLGKRKMYIPKGIRALAVNSKNYLNEKENKIPVEELFMYRYLQRKQNEHKQKQDDEESDISSVTSEDFDHILGKLSGDKDYEEIELDYMNDIGESRKNKKKGNKQNEEDANEEASDDDSQDDMEDGDVTFSDQEDDFDEDDIDRPDEGDEELEDINFDDDGDDESVIEFGSDSEEETDKNTKKKRKPNLKKLKNDMKSIFASADEFAALLDEEEDFKSGTSNALSNKDNAHKKQLSWEFNRNRWIKGADKSKSGKKFNDKNKFSNKRKNNNKNATKSKKFKNM